MNILKSKHDMLAKCLSEIFKKVTDTLNKSMLTLFLKWKFLKFLHYY